MTSAVWNSLGDRLGLDLILQFGSSVRPGSAPRDLDLAVSGPDTPDVDLARVFCQELSRGDLDLAWLPTADWLLSWEAARPNALLFERTHGEYAEFRNAACRRWMEGRGVWGRRQQEYLRRFLANDLAMNRDLVIRKCGQLALYLRQLEETLPETEVELEQDHILQHAAERLLELLVEDAAAINTEMCFDAGIPASDYYSSFFSMVSAGHLDSEVASALAPYATLRNTLVHRYDRIQVRQLHSQLKACIPLFRAYLSQIERTI